MCCLFCTAVDASGNAVLSDIGVYLKQQLEHRLAALNIPTTIKHIGRMDNAHAHAYGAVQLEAASLDELLISLSVCLSV